MRPDAGLDYHILAPGYDEPFLREVRSDAAKAADDHVIYKTSLKAMAHQHGMSVRFMAKPDHTWISSSCHIHSSLRRERFPHTLRDAIAALEQGTMARQAFGEEVVDHYLTYARTERRLFDEAVTCYVRERMFERE